MLFPALRFGAFRIFTTFLFCAASLTTSAMDWPQEITANEGKIIVYQPQPENLTGNVLSGRAAMSLELKNKKEPIFGAFWFTAKLDTDTDAGTATVRSIDVTRVRWPDSTADEEQRFTEIVETNLAKSDFTISLERLSASLESANIERESLEELKNDPPNILFSDQLAILLLFDGTPKFSDVENSSYERALNTPFLVVHKKKNGPYYLSSGQLWYSAKEPLGPWTPTNSPPADLVKMLPKPDDDQPPPSQPPQIIATTEPSELISTDGAPKWKTLPGGSLLYVENTEMPWIRDVSAGKMYVLLSGRWYQSSKQDGPWTFIRADKLPASFKDIPPASDIGGLRVSVAGTDEAEEAMMDAQIPQTTAVKRSEAKLEVTYDGEPKFEKIPGTQVSYAVNTGAQVLRINDHYYAVDNAVWFTASSAKGPWVVADSIPKEEISKIPPSSPVYNTTYVNIYESTPDVVYTGYTPGYLWSFPYYGVPVYGTGWNYPPYWGGAYYPRPPTWGFHVGYNPWTGWNFGVSWSNGFFSFGAAWGGGWSGPYRPWGCCGGWYGGGYHRAPVVINTGNIHIGNNINIGNRTNIKNSINKRSQVNTLANRNIYKRPENRARNADPKIAKRDLQQARVAKNRDNNVFADQHGNVARKVNDQWQVRENGQWKADKMPATVSEHAAQIKQQAPEIRNDIASGNFNRPENLPSRPSTQQGNNLNRNSFDRSSFDRNSLNRDFSARQRGMSRERAMPQMRGGFRR